MLELLTGQENPLVSQLAVVLWEHDSPNALSAMAKGGDDYRAYRFSETVLTQGGA